MNTAKHGTITFITCSAYAVWIGEILGQLSDGMWENAAPYDHWEFWWDLEPRIGPVAKVESSKSWACKKTGYNLAGLYECVGDRMLAYGRMGRVTPDPELIKAASYMPPTFGEWLANKVSGVWKHDWVKPYMEPVTERVALAFYATTYTMKDLRADIKVIKTAMKTR